MILALSFLILNYLFGYKILKYHLLGEVDRRNGSLIVLGAFLIGNIICGSSLYILDLIFVKYFNNYYLSILIYSAVTLAVIFWHTNIKIFFESICSEFRNIFNDRIKIAISILYLFYCIWLYYGTLTVGDGYVKTDAGWGDSLYHLAYVNLIKLTNNIPIEYPFFANQPVHYHFMYDYLVGKYAYLGINSVHALNALSILSYFALLLLIYEFGVVYFKNKLVGVLGSLFLIFHSSLASLIWLIENLDIKILSTLYYRSPGAFINLAKFESWGLFNHNVYKEQKHFPYALAMLVFVILTFYTFRYLSRYKFSNSSKQFVILGFIIGLLPYWHAVICFVSLAIISLLTLLEFRNRAFFINSIKLIAVASVMAIPQLLFLKSGDTVLSEYPKIFFGYGAQNGSLISIGEYYAKVLGIKVVLIIVGFVLLTKFQRKEYLVFAVPLILANVFQFGYILYDNNKLIICSLIFLNILAAYSIACLYNLLKDKLKTSFVAVVPIVLVLLCTFAGILDFFSINNRKLLSFPNDNSELKAWIMKNTDPKDIFLTYHTLPFGDSSIITINFAGRKVYGVWNYVISQENIYPRKDLTKKIYGMKDNEIEEVKELIKKEKIEYIVFDKLVRGAKDMDPDEEVFKKYFKLYYSSKDVNIYSVQ